MASAPATMRSLTASSYCNPKKYEISTQPTPAIYKPIDVLVKVHAACIATGDTQRATGLGRFAKKTAFPFQIGMELSGVVLATSPVVTAIHPGDEVYGCWFEVGAASGFVSEYAICPAQFLLPKHPSTTHTAACSLTGSAITALQSFNRAFILLPPEEILQGKTVFVSDALSATGSPSCQIAKTVYGAGKVIATVFTPKVPLVEKYLGPGVVDRSSTTGRKIPLSEVSAGSVDFLYNTQWQVTSLIPLVDFFTGVIISIASYPPSSVVRRLLPKVPRWICWIADLLQLWYMWKLWGNRLKYEFVSGTPSVRADLERVAELVAEGKIRAVVGRVVGLEDTAAPILALLQGQPEQMIG